MNKRILVRAATAAVLFAALPLSAVAVSTPTPTPSAAQAQRLTNLKSKGTAEIDRRLANLNSALGKLNASTKLTAANKATLAKQIQDEIAGLTALKAKLAADTELATARTDVASIVSDYRVYALMLPKARLVSSADRFAVAEDKLQTLHDKLAAKPLKDGANDVAEKLADMQAKITAAKTISDPLTAQLLAIQPTDYNANHATLVQYRASLKTAQDDLKAARDDAKSVIATLGR
jgi:hypothetical protein